MLKERERGNGSVVMWPTHQGEKPFTEIPSVILLGEKYEKKEKADSRAIWGHVRKSISDRTKTKCIN